MGEGKMYQSVIFDIDGTLLETEKAIILTLQRVLKEELAKDYDVSDLDFVLGAPGEDILRRFGIVDVERVMKKWDEYQKDSHHHMSVFPEIEEVLETLIEKGIITGIVTSKTRREFENDFEPFGLTRFFTYMITADDTTKYKPDPEPLFKFVEMAGIHPEEAIYIGDTIYDLNCAKAAGIDFALALWGTRNGDEIPSRLKLKSPKQLLSVVFLEPSP
jgi:HAD superfamily hydrolase (TIGR01549 family)